MTIPERIKKWKEIAEAADNIRNKYLPTEDPEYVRFFITFRPSTILEILEELEKRI